MAKCHICQSKVGTGIPMGVPGVFGERDSPDDVVVCRSCWKKWSCPGCSASLYGSLEDMSICPYCQHDKSRPRSWGRAVQVAFLLIAVLAFALGRVFIH